MARRPRSRPPCPRHPAPAAARAGSPPRRRRRARAPSCRWSRPGRHDALVSAIAQAWRMVSARSQCRCRMVFGMTATAGKNRNAVLVSAFAAAAIGVAGLAALALPAGAGQQPSLPEISAEELVSSALSAQPPAMNGTIGVDNALGLPAVPGLPTQLT